MARQSYAAQEARIQKEIEKLKKQAAALQNKKRLPAIRSIIKTMKEYGITLEEVATAYNKGAGKSKGSTKASGSTRGPRGPVPPKYRHPETGQEWSGRGIAPKWITQAETEGKSRHDFLIK